MYHIQYFSSVAYLLYAYIIYFKKLLQNYRVQINVKYGLLYYRLHNVLHLISISHVQENQIDFICQFTNKMFEWATLMFMERHFKIMFDPIFYSPA